MTPRRIQLRRTKGWRKPEGAVVVARPSNWGNPFSVTEFGRERAVLNYQLRLTGLLAIGAVDLTRLRDKDLACWCRLCDRHRDGRPMDEEPCDDCAPCHADVLLEMANGS